MEINRAELERLGVELLLLFGSRARGTARQNSDTDLGVLFRQGFAHGYHQVDQLREVLRGGADLDLVSLNDANALLLREAALDGVPQFERRPGSIEEFRLLAFKRYMDTAKFRRLQAETPDPALRLMVKPDLIRHKLAMLHRYLRELEAHREITLEQYLEAGDRLRAIERLLQLIVEAAVDINTHIVTEMEGLPPTDYTDSFQAAVRCGFIPAELGELLKPSAGLRNALVHEYGGIDDQRVHASIVLALDGFIRYQQSLTAWLSTRSE